MILKIIFFTSFRRSLCVFVQIFCVVRWQRAAAHANGKSQKCCNDGIRNNFHQNDCQRVPIKNNALSQRNVCTQSACGSSSSSRNTHPLSISRSSKQHRDSFLALVILENPEIPPHTNKEIISRHFSQVIYKLVTSMLKH